METILIWMTVALVGGYAFKILSLPTSAGFIIAGYILTLFNFSDEADYLTIPAEIGVGLLLFSLGLKIKPSYFYNKYLILVFVAHSIAVSSFFFLLLQLDVGLEIKLGLCIALSVSSTIVASKALETRREISTFHGRISVIILVFQDILALALLLYSQPNTLMLETVALLFVPFSIPLIKRLLRTLHPNEELELLAAIIIAVFLGMTLFSSLGLSGEIGALVMGILLSGHESADRLAKRIWSLREFLLLAFFLGLGMTVQINYEIFLDSLMLLSLLMLKFLILFFLLLAFKLRAYTAFLISISLSTFSEFALIVVAYWNKAGLIEDEISAIVICTTCLSFILGSILNKYVHEIYGQLEPFLIKFERSTYHPDEEPHTCGEAQVMILGMGRVGTAIFENLTKNNIKVVGFDADTELVVSHLRDGKRVTFADAEDPGFWSKLRFGKLTTIILALPEFHAQNWSTQRARKNGFQGKIIVPTRSQGDPEVLKLSGANEIYDAYEAAGLGVAEILLKE